MTENGEPPGKQAAKAAQFRALHHEGIFVMPCAWDAGSARLSASTGFVTEASREMLDLGTFGFGAGAMSDTDIDKLNISDPSG